MSGKSDEKRPGQRYLTWAEGTTIRIMLKLAYLAGQENDENVQVQEVPVYRDTEKVQRDILEAIEKKLDGRWYPKDEEHERACEQAGRSAGIDGKKIMATWGS